jgi:hypothetical protein
MKGGREKREREGKRERKGEGGREGGRERERERERKRRERGRKRREKERGRDKERGREKQAGQGPNIPFKAGPPGPMFSNRIYLLKFLPLLPIASPPAAQKVLSKPAAPGTVENTPDQIVTLGACCSLDSPPSYILNLLSGITNVSFAMEHPV